MKPVRAAGNNQFPSQSDHGVADQEIATFVPYWASRLERPEKTSEPAASQHFSRIG
jgi:hypothetical protein